MTHRNEGLPWRRVEPAISRFISCCQVDLDRLHQHRKNIEKLQTEGEGVQPKLFKEQENLARTIQQLKVNMLEIEKVYHQTREEDWSKVEARLQPIKERFDATLAEFAAEKSAPDQCVAFLCQSNSSDSASAAGNSLSPVELGTAAEKNDPLEQHHSMHCDKQLHVSMENAKKSEEISKDLESIHGMMITLSTMIHSQSETVDTIESNIEKTADNVYIGGRQLAKASQYKAALFPLLGALVGGAVGGPVGLVAGLKIGGIAALGGATIGVVAGRQLKKMKDKTVQADQEMMDAATLRFVDKDR